MVLFLVFTSVAQSVITIQVEQPRDRGWFPEEGKEVYFVSEYSTPSTSALEHILLPIQLGEGGEKN